MGRSPILVASLGQPREGAAREGSLHCTSHRHNAGINTHPPGCLCVEMSGKIVFPIVRTSNPVLVASILLAKSRRAAGPYPKRRSSNADKNDPRSSYGSPALVVLLCMRNSRT